MRKINDELWLSGLPLAKDLAAWKPASVLDLTRRARPTVERACRRLAIDYRKSGVEYNGIGASQASRLFEDLPKPCLVHCFHGRDRAPLVARWIMRRRLDVCLYCVGRNFNRAYRACAAFGVRRMLTYQCSGRIDGSLYGAQDDVEIVEVDSIPPNAVILDQHGDTRIEDLDWLEVRELVVGGETAGVPSSVRGRRVRIEQDHRLELTVEAALSIALYRIGT